MTGGASVGAVVREATARLRAAGFESAGAEARTLLSAVLKCAPATLILAADLSRAQAAAYSALVRRRIAGMPVQHLTGEAWFRTVRVAVGPGVFTPRPETEVMTGWAIDHLRHLQDQGVSAPAVVDLCTGSGAISLAIAAEVPGCRQWAVELSPEASAYAERNLAGTAVELSQADLADCLADLDGVVDLVICNPPYIPLDAFLDVTEEVRRHEPALALFSGDDGLDAMRVLARTGARLLRPGGVLCAEHAELQQESAPAVFVAQGQWLRVRGHRDLTDRPRFVTAVRR